MAPFPGSASHWHVTTPQKLRSEVERLSRQEALARLGRRLIADRDVTGDPRYSAGLAALSAGWTTVQLGPHVYAAFACSCPPRAPDVEIHGGVHARWRLDHAARGGR